MLTRRLVLALILASLAACGDNHPAANPDAMPDAPAAPDGQAAWTVETVCGAISERVCAQLESCDCRFDIRPYDASTCVAARTASCVSGFGAKVGPDLTAGRARFDGPSIDRCIAAIGGNCDLPANFQLPPACDTIVLDVAPVASACTVTGGGLAYCADGAGVCVPGESGATCTALPGDGDSCPYNLCTAGLTCTTAGTCGAAGAVGAVCLIGSDCAPGLVCPPSGQCAAPLASGAICNDYHQCAVGLTCADGICAAAVALGDGCNTQDVCGPTRGCGRAPETRTCADPDPQGAMCMDGTCATGLGCSSTTMTCAMLPGNGDECLDGFACAAGLTCADGLNTCVPLPGNGETCAVGNRFCADGLGCDQTDNTCRPGPGANEPCLLNPPDYVCGAGLGCDFGANGSICVPIGGAGADCNSDRTCGTGTYCEFSTLKCTPRLADGASCNDGNECMTGSECARSATGYHCAKIPGRDQPCDSACTGALACKGPGGTCVPSFCLIP
ncbi:MAG: hypothetical protein K8W52_17595 [Deltaproteobacteria bacterium]|nr:hypothetical protein [Deltaproteobacteria bacterium]